MGSIPQQNPNKQMQSMDRVPMDMQMPERQPMKPWQEIPTGNAPRKKKPGSREGMKVSSGGGTGTNVPS